jgi:hypothetical protein
MRAGWYRIRFRPCWDDLGQVAETGDGEVGEHAALEYDQIALHRVQFGRVRW